MQSIILSAVRYIIFLSLPLLLILPGKVAQCESNGMPEKKVINKEQTIQQTVAKANTDELLHGELLMRY